MTPTIVDLLDAVGRLTLTEMETILAPRMPDYAGMRAVLFALNKIGEEEKKKAAKPAPYVPPAHAETKPVDKEGFFAVSFPAKPSDALTIQEVSRLVDLPLPALVAVNEIRRRLGKQTIPLVDTNPEMHFVERIRSIVTRAAGTDRGGEAAAFRQIKTFFETEK